MSYGCVAVYCQDTVFKWLVPSKNFDKFLNYSIDRVTGCCYLTLRIYHVNISVPDKAMKDNLSNSSIVISVFKEKIERNATQD